MSNSSIEPRYRILSGTTNPGHSGPRIDGNEGALHCHQSISITGALSSDCLMSFYGHLLVRGRSYPSVEMQSVYSTATNDWDLCF